MIKEVEIDKIVVNPYQPRDVFSDDALDELAQSIQSVGIIHPPVVRQLGNTFELISGERRYRAAKLAGLVKIPVVVHEGTRSYSAQATLIENIQRVDLNPLEIAKGLKRLLEEFGFHHEELADRVGKKRATVTNYLRLLSLPKAIQDSLKSGQITMGHAKAILSLDGFDKQLQCFEAIIADDLSCREAESLAQKLALQKMAPPTRILTRDVFLESLQQKLEEKFGTKVLVEGKGKKGTIKIEYFDLDDLDRVLQILGVQE
jgi:ParB family chromosome partitioning protein